MTIIEKMGESAVVALVAGLGTGGVAAVGIWGSRYVSKLPQLPFHVAGVVTVATGLSFFVACCVAQQFFSNNNQKYKLGALITLFGITGIGGIALTIYGNSQLVKRNIVPLCKNISPLSSAITSVVSQFILCSALVLLS